MKDRVIFRQWNEKHGRGIVAILPDVDANPGYVMMYEHIGQHGEGDYRVVMEKSRPVRLDPGAIADMQDLWAELEARGYKLRRIERLNRRQRK